MQPFTSGHLVNMSIRTASGAGDDTLIVGAAFGGGGTSGTKAVLLRAVGPTLGTCGVTGALVDPVMTVFQGSAEFPQNDNWDSAVAPTFASVGAFNFITGSKDAALVATLPPGSYTALVSGVDGTTGVTLVEDYELP